MWLFVVVYYYYWFEKEILKIKNIKYKI